MTTVPHIVQYQGSKRILAPQILRYMPFHFTRLVEPFAGMAAITIAAAMHRRADEYVINDLNEPLVGVLRAAIETPLELVERYAGVWGEQFSYAQGSIAHFYKVRTDFNDGNKNPANMLYLLARCVKGSVRYGSNGQFNQSPDKRRNGTSPKKLKPNVLAISLYLKGRTTFHSTDYREVLDTARTGDVVYMDPPYQGVSNVRDRRYFSGIDFGGFVEAVDRLNSRGVDFLISYDGRCGDRQYGEDLPEGLGLKKVLLNAGLSSQSLLLGRKEITYEALTSAIVCNVSCQCKRRFFRIRFLIRSQYEKAIESFPRQIERRIGQATKDGHSAYSSIWVCDNRGVEESRLRACTACSTRCPGTWHTSRNILDQRFKRSSHWRVSFWEAFPNWR